MRHLLPQLVVILLGVCLMVFSACASNPPSRFYIVTPMSDAEMTHPSRTNEHDLIIGLGPITLPLYLDRSQIVTRTSLARLKLAKFDQWAAPLQDNFSRMLPRICRA